MQSSHVTSTRLQQPWTTQEAVWGSMGNVLTQHIPSQGPAGEVLVQLKLFPQQEPRGRVVAAILAVLLREHTPFYPACNLHLLGPVLLKLANGPVCLVPVVHTFQFSLSSCF